MTLLLFLLACTHTDTADSKTGGSTDTADSAPAPDGCSGGGWGEYGDSAVSPIYVAAGGTGDGTEEAPFGSVADALAVAIPGTTIVVGAGTFPVQALIQDPSTQEGLSIVGCGRDETIFEPTSATTSILFVNDVPDVAFRGLKLSGGERTVWLQDDATVTLQDVLVDQPARTGVFVYGAVVATLIDVDINTPALATDSAYAYGISVRGASAVSQANLSMEGGGIVAGSPVGMIAEAATITLSKTSITGTLPDASNLYGRGLQLQGYSSATISASIFDENQDAGIFAIDALQVTIDGDTAITNTRAGTAPDSGEATGDGLVATLSEDAQGAFTYAALIDGANFTGNARAGGLFDAVEYEVRAATASDNGGAVVDGDASHAFFAQNGATDAGTSAEVYPLATAVDFNRVELTAESP